MWKWHLTRVIANLAIHLSVLGLLVRPAACSAQDAPEKLGARTPLAKADVEWVRLGRREAETPLRFGNQKQLLVDNHVLADWWKVRRVQGKLRKHPNNPIIVPDAPWEETARKSWGIVPASVIYDETDGLFKMWYKIEKHTGGNVMAYAVSKDGVDWEKPILGLVEFGGTKKNNVLRLEPYGIPLQGNIHLIQEPREGRPPQRRFRAISIRPFHKDGTPYGGWLGIGTSAGGLTWHLVPGGDREGGGGGNPSVLWDSGLGKYVMFGRQLGAIADPEQRTIRYIVRQESSDLVHWSPRQTVFKPMEPTRWPEVESMMTFRYQGIYFGLPNMLENEVRGEVEIHLVTSRDGFRWDHPFPDEAFIPRGAPGDFDDKVLWLPQTVMHGDTMYFYYGGGRYTHNARKILPDRRQIKIGLATLPADRFMGLRADEPLGALLTRPLIVEGDELIVNADVEDELRVEVLEPAIEYVDIGRKAYMGHYITYRQRTYPGFSAKDCQPVSGDSLRHRIAWKGGAFGKLKGKAVRLRFVARKATIYAFQVASREPREHNQVKK